MCQRNFSLASVHNYSPVGVSTTTRTAGAWRGWTAGSPSNAPTSTTRPAAGKTDAEMLQAHLGLGIGFLETGEASRLPREPGLSLSPGAARVGPGPGWLAILVCRLLVWAFAGASLPIFGTDRTSAL